MGKLYINNGFTYSLIHRNYMGAPTQIRVYDKKLFIWNDGSLPPTITLSQLKENHSSHPRNPILAEACFKGGYIDAWGSGIMKIINSCQVAGLPTPDLKEKEGGFIVTLYKDRYSEEQLQQLGLNERQIDAVIFFKDKKEITTAEYQTHFNVAARTARYDLTELVEKNVMEKIGENKNAKYVFCR